MSNFDELSPDPLALDGRSLRVFLTVLETGSITAAANQLGVTQSAVSHTIEKLRGILHDQLFVKSGRGIVPTAHALKLQRTAKQLLEDMQAFSRGAHFEPASEEISITIAANDYVRNLLLPPFFTRIKPQLKNLQINIITSGWPTAALLRDSHCDLILTPKPPEALDIMQKSLMTDRYACFFDPAERSAPANLDEYLEAEHIVVVYDHTRKLDFDQFVEKKGLHRKVALMLPNFATVLPFLRGTRMIACMPELVRLHLMHGFGVTSLPFEPPELPMYMVWHKRHQDDPAHRWLRSQLEISTREVLASVSG